MNSTEKPCVFVAIRGKHLSAVGLSETLYILGGFDGTKCTEVVDEMLGSEPILNDFWLRNTVFLSWF